MLQFLIPAAASLVGGALASKSQKRAANQASDAQVQVAEKNNALQRELYQANTANFQPYMQSGTRANALLDSFIYGAPPAGQAPAAATQPVGQPQPVGQGGGITLSNDLAFNGRQFGVGDSLNGYTARNAMGARNLQVMADRGGSFVPGGANPSTPGINPAANDVPAPGANPLGGYEAFVNSPYYQNPLQEGFRALNHGLASGGMLNSGDAMKRALRYGQDYGAGRQDEFLRLVEGQVNRGAGAASSIAGVSQNYGNAVSGNNQNAADAISNAALLRGQANASLFGGIGNALGGLASSYKGFGI